MGAKIDKRPVSVCLLSGGLDSCVTAAFAREAGCELAMLHVNYGQKTEARELKAFNEICDYFGVTDDRRLVVDIGYLKAIGGSALTDSRIEVPKGTVTGQGIPITYVPFRNAHLIAIATSWGEVIGARYLYIGATEVDFSGYPDCRRSFFDAMELAIEQGTRPETNIRIITPIIKMGKREVVKEGVRLGAPLELTWSCYENEEIACGRCESCILRLKGFKEAGIKDPIPYEEGIGG